jgi:hypothetical protein
MGCAMSARDLSVLIPSRQEPFLRHTILDVLAAIQADTEIIVVCDGALPVEPIDDHPRVKLVLLPKSIGQRAATNLAARMSKAKYILKIDAHCRVSPGFDSALIADCQPDWTMIPTQYNLHVFDWQCNSCDNRTYQGPTPTVCAKCGKSEGFERIMVWQPRWHKRTDTWRFDKGLHFQYWRELMKRPEIKAQGDLHDTMSLLGACWFLERERYWQLDGLDEQHGSWGQMGTEIACKTWLSGGRLVVTKRAWFAHLFRTQGGDFGFPYEMHGEDQLHARRHSQDLWLNDKWPKAIHPVSWLIDKFKPIPDWHDGPAIMQSESSKSIVFYTDCLAPDPITEAVHAQLLCSDVQIVSVSLGKALDFGENIIVERERSVLTMYYQILAGLERAKGEIIYMAEHDVLYNPSHFEYVPPSKTAYFYNLNLWRVDSSTGHALFYNTTAQSQLVAYRETLLTHYRARIARIEAEGHYSRSIGHEPGLHRAPRGIDKLPALSFCSAYPNIDIRHGGNLTKSRWSKRQFHDKRTCSGWTEADTVPYWGRTEGRFSEFLASLSQS